jgi:hypothetical protein
MTNHGRSPQTLTLWGETKTLREWSQDPRSQISHATLRKRQWQGIEGSMILARKGRAGRPRKA